jgi:hypothetical protein
MAVLPARRALGPSKVLVQPHTAGFRAPCVVAPRRTLSTHPLVLWSFGPQLRPLSEPGRSNNDNQ